MRSPRLITALFVLAALCPMAAQAQVAIPARFYWKSLAGGNAVPVIYQSLSGNVNPLDPAYVVSDASVEASMAVVGYAKVLPLWGRTATFAFLEPVGRLSSTSAIEGLTTLEDASGYGDPTIEAGINLIGPKAQMNIPDALRYEPGFSLDVIVDLVFPIGEYDSEKSLNLGQNRWYGRVGAPIVWQFGPWVPGRRTTLELFPSIWLYGDNDDFSGTTLSTDPLLQVELHLTRDFTSHFWGSFDATTLSGGASTIHGVEGDAKSTLGVGFTLGYQVNDNLGLTLGYMSTVNDSGPTDLRLDAFRISFTYGWHPLIEGQKRLGSGE
jgi:hypothetical protein